MKTGCVGGVDQLVVLLGRSRAEFEQPPAPVEEVDSQAPVGRSVDGVNGSVVHDVLLAFDQAL
jgi:hypothetical protein